MAEVINPGSLNRLTAHALPLFTKDTLFDEIARTLCKAACLPRKELYEAWEVARRARRRFRGGRVIDMACGHGLLAHIVLILDDSSPSALAVDKKVPPSASKIAKVLEERWPRLSGRIAYERKKLQTVEVTSSDVIVSAHACGKLTDLVLDKAIEAHCRVAVLPCCHAIGKSDLGGLAGWMDGTLAIDATRAARLRNSGFKVHTQTIPEQITPKNRLLLGTPVSGS